MNLKGDSERQAFLRDRMIKRRSTDGVDPYLLKIDRMLQPGMSFCDIGCGTGHIIQQLAELHRGCHFVGLDNSRAMIAMAARNTAGLSNISILVGDGCEVPFRDRRFDIVASRLAPYSLTEALRVLRRNGHIIEYSLGPDANKEVMEFFSERVDPSSFYMPEDPTSWREEVAERIEEAGFNILEVEDRIELTYQTQEELADLIEMVPLVEHFHREKDHAVLRKIAEKYSSMRGIQNTWHYCISIAEKP